MLAKLLLAVVLTYTAAKVERKRRLPQERTHKESIMKTKSHWYCCVHLRCCTGAVVVASMVGAVLCSLTPQISC